MKKVIACEVLENEIKFVKNKFNLIFDEIYLEQGLHNTPSKLKEGIQKEIDRYENKKIYLLFGLCSNGISDIKSRTNTLYVPKIHDCFSLFLGSKKMFNDITKNNKGIYFYTPSWIEKAEMPSKDFYDKIYLDYVEKFGEDNAEYLLEMDKNYLNDYKNLAYIYWNEFNKEKHRQIAKESADYLGLKFIEYLGSPSLLKALLTSPEGHKDVLTVPPRHKIIPTYDNEVIAASACSSNSH